MIWAFLAVGLGALTIGVYLGVGGAAILAASRSCAIRRSRDRWRARALAAERWLPTEIVVDILAEEHAS